MGEACQKCEEMSNETSVLQKPGENLCSDSQGWSPVEGVRASPS